MMDNQLILSGVLMDETTKISFVEVCQKCHISEDVLLDMIEHGLFHHDAQHLKNIQIDQKTLVRIQSACRLQHDLGINLPGVVLVLELLDELAQIQDEFDILQHHIRREY